MTVSVIPLKQLTGTLALVTIFGPVPDGEKWRLDLRATNITNPGAAGAANVWVKDNVTPANSGYRTRNLDIPFNQAGSAVDLEYGLVVTAGMEIQISASVVDAIAFSASGVKDA